MATVPEALAAALQHHQAGRLQEAEALYQQILQAEPNNPDALHLLGVIAHQVGKHDVAAEYIRQAIALNPGAAEYHSNIGEVYRVQGKKEEAIAHYRKALAIRPVYPEAHNNLGIVIQDQGKLEEAIAHYRQALALKPDYAEAHNNLGLALQAQGKLAEAVGCYRQALTLKPAYPEAHNNWGLVLGEQGKLAEAIEHYCTALCLDPAYAMAHNNLGNVLLEQGKLEEAAVQYRQALVLDPDLMEAYNNLGKALKEEGKADEAVRCYQRALALKPDHAAVHSNVLFCLNYCSAYDPADIYVRHKEWNEQHARALTPKTVPRPSLHDSAPIRIGYVSADFKGHPVGYFLEPVLGAHDKAQFKIYCYSGVVKDDAVTVRMQALADEWRNIARMSDEDVARTIREDGIDILVDLSGHTAGNRLLVFARRPAPVQVTWIGYVNTTGLNTMDYLIADGYAVPLETAQLFTERLVRLPDSYLCFRPPQDAPPVLDCPALSKGHVTFGCFNNFSKVNETVVEVWSKILREIRTARLVLKNKSLNDPRTKENCRKLFLKYEILPERIDFLGFSPHAELLAQYGRIDIALDPFPYSGGLTTLEALWMGVPVVTLAGMQFVSRTGVSLLSSVGLTELIANSPEQYVELAVHLGLDLDRLSRLRAGMRHRVATSSLCDVTSFTRKLEDAYRAMWQNRCDGAITC